MKKPNVLHLWLALVCLMLLATSAAMASCNEVKPTSKALLTSAHTTCGSCRQFPCSTMQRLNTTNFNSTNKLTANSIAQFFNFGVGGSGASDHRAKSMQRADLPSNADTTQRPNAFAGVTANFALCGSAGQSNFCNAKPKQCPAATCGSANCNKPQHLDGQSASPQTLATTAQAAAVVERFSGRVLFQKNADTPLPMASTTKIVTALTVLQNCPNLNKVVTVPPQACGVEGSSVYLQAGEQLTILQLLFGLMLRSGNDCAVALAIEVGGSVQNFAQMMNQTAQSLGCTHSNFVNPHGLHDDNHYTTASDLAKLTCCALQNQHFAGIVATKSCTIPSPQGQRLLVNKNKLLQQGADGVKTGYTKKAGRCFVGSATKNNMQVVVVVLNCAPMFQETSAMLQAAFANYTMHTVIPQNKLCGAVYRKGKPTYYFAPQPFCYPLAAGEKPKVQVQVEDDVQQIAVSLQGKLIHTQQLQAFAP